jgi:nucleotide-binding universal stress UspA family protein
MTTNGIILHPTDFSSESSFVLRYAYEWAKRSNQELHVLHVAFPLGDDPLRGAFAAQIDEEEFYREIWEAADEQMTALIREVESSDVPVRRVHSRGTDPAPIIINYAESQDVDLVVMGTAGRTGISRLLNRSVAVDVVRESACPVVVTREGSAMPNSISRILVPVDLSAFSAPLLRAAARVAGDFDAELVITHVVEPLPFPVPLVGAVTIHDLIPDPIRETEVHLKRLIESMEGLPDGVRVHVHEGHAAVGIQEAAEEVNADLVVMASHGRSGLERIMLGSVTARVLRRSECAVQVLRVEPELDAEETSVSAPGADRKNVSP